MEPVLALVLGFRVVDKKDIKIINDINKNTNNMNIIQDISLTPKGWENLPGGIAIVTKILDTLNYYHHLSS